MSSYRDLPPGRARMLAYAEETELNRNLRSTRDRDSIASVLTSSSWPRIASLTFGTIRSRQYLRQSDTFQYEILSEFQDVKVGLVSKDLLDKTQVENSKNLSFCTICQHDIYLDIVRLLECGHSYHINCIDRWFVDNKKCPQCRHEI